MILAGEIVPAGRLGRMQPVTYEAAASSSLDITDSTTISDITGASVTLTTAAANAIAIVDGTFDCNVITTNASTLMLGRLNVDGSDQTAQATYAMDTALRGTVTQTWRVTLASAGSHTLKLRGSLSAASGRGVFTFQNTKIQIMILEVV
ncbi:hypothetical protein ABGB07_03925 [Micromonosporaceae bacterium B7E4]